MAEQRTPPPERVYVPVKVNFDKTGYMVPTELQWTDGRRFPIDKVLDLQTVDTGNNGLRRQRYQIRIRDQVTYLYFEKNLTLYGFQYGRWFVQRKPPEEYRPAR